MGGAGYKIFTHRFCKLKNINFIKKKHLDSKSKTDKQCQTTCMKKSAQQELRKANAVLLHQTAKSDTTMPQAAH